MDDSSKRSDFVTATCGSEAEHATSSTSYLSAVEEQIERSKAHWSTLTDHSGYTDEEELNFEVSNLQEFQALQEHPTWGGFFANFTGDGISTGSNYLDLGTNFFRAPEILQACKDRKINERPEVFSKAADVYSYGMTCYEILTGELPFENHPLRYSISSLTNLVINEHLRPQVAKYVDDWAKQLVERCWQSDPSARPRIREVLDLLSLNSMEVKKCEISLKEKFGEN